MRRQAQRTCLFRGKFDALCIELDYQLTGWLGSPSPALLLRFGRSLGCHAYLLFLEPQTLAIILRARRRVMDKRTSRGQSQDDACRPDKLLSFPGIKEAIALVKEHAYFLAVEKTMDAAAEGELGDELRQLMSSDAFETLDRLFEDELAGSFLAETEDGILEDLAVEAGPKIAELWELSEPAGERLSQFIYWEENPGIYIAQPYWLPFVLVVNTTRPEGLATLRSEYTEFLRRNTVVVPPEGMKEGHIYLDVTYLPYKALSLAYGTLLFCREKLGIQKQDLREGAPPSVDGEKALRSAQLERTKGGKAAARELGFRIYMSDNPSGSSPLFRKYSKTGRLMERRLEMLDAFLSSLEDNLRKT